METEEQVKVWAEIARLSLKAEHLKTDLAELRETVFGHIDAVKDRVKRLEERGQG